MIESRRRRGKCDRDEGSNGLGPYRCFDDD